MTRRSRTIGLRAVRALLVIGGFAFGPVVAQESPCAGKVEHFPIEGVGRPQVLAVNSHRMLSTDGPTFSNWGLCDPNTPQFLGRWTMWDERYISYIPIRLDDRGFAFAGYGNIGGGSESFSIRVWDARAAGPPRPISVLPYGWIDFFLDGDLLVGIDTNIQLTIIDVGDPFHPEVVCAGCGGIELGNGPPSLGGDYLRIEKTGDLAAVLDFDELKFVDYSNPLEPQVSSIPLSQMYSLRSSLWANDHVAALASDAHFRFELVDVADPENPIVTTIPFDPNSTSWGDFHGDVLVLEENNGSQARRLDLSDPTAPVELSPIDFGLLADTGAIWNDRLYIGTPAGARIYDLTGTPTEVGQGPPDEYANELSVSGPTGLATGRQMLLTYDLASPGGPAEEARLHLDWWPQKPTVDGSLGAVSSYGVGAVLVDLSTLSSPQFIHTLPVEGAIVVELEIKGDLLAVASRNDDNAGWVELWRVSLTEPPEFLSRIGAGEVVWQIEMDADRIFLGLDDAVQEFDITDPAVPVAGTPLDLDYLRYRVSGMAVAGSELFVSDEYQVGILDVSVPGSPLQRDLVSGEFWGEWLASDGDVVVGGANGGSLWIIRSPTTGDVIPMMDLQAPSGWGHRGGFFDGAFYQARGHNLAILDLGCDLPEPDFTWYGMGTKVRFIDRTTYDDWGDDRSWTWTTDHDPDPRSTRSPLIDFEEFETFDVTMDATVENGIVSVTKTIVVFEQPEADLVFADGFERGGFCVWSFAGP